MWLGAKIGPVSIRLARRRLAPSLPAIGAVMGLVGVLLLFFPLASAATEGDDLVVIANPECGSTRLTRVEVIEIFFGRQRRLPCGVAALTVDLAAPSGAKREFYSRLVGKTPREIQSYWARLVFSGRSAAPWQAEGPNEVLSIVSQYKGAIGYVRAAEVSEDVRIVHRLTE